MVDRELPFLRRGHGKRLAIHQRPADLDGQPRQAFLHCRAGGRPADPHAPEPVRHVAGAGRMDMQGLPRHDHSLLRKLQI